MKIPTNETILRENLHQAVDSLSLVNIIILFMLIRVVQVVTYLRPGERDIVSLPAPRPELADGEQGTGPELSKWHIGNAPLEPSWDSQGRWRPQHVGYDLPFPYTGANDVAGVTVGSGPEPNSGEVTLTLADGREVSFQEWHMDVERQRRSLDFAQYGGARENYSTIRVEVDSPWQNGSYTTKVPVLGWAETDYHDRIVMFRHPGSGEFVLRTYDTPGLIHAIQYSPESLQYQCERGNAILRERSWAHGGEMGYCTPSRHGMYTVGRSGAYFGSDGHYHSANFPEFPHIAPRNTGDE